MKKNCAVFVDPDAWDYLKRYCEESGLKWGHYIGALIQARADVLKAQELDIVDAAASHPACIPDQADALRRIVAEKRVVANG